MGDEAQYIKWAVMVGKGEPPPNTEVQKVKLFKTNS